MLDPESYFKGEAVALSTAMWTIRLLHDCGKRIDDPTYETLKKEMVRLAKEIDQLAVSILDQDVNASKKMTDSIEAVLE